MCGAGKIAPVIARLCASALLPLFPAKAGTQIHPERIVGFTSPPAFAGEIGGNIRHGHRLADHQQCRPLQALGSDGQSGQSGQDAALMNAAGVLDDQGRRRRGAARSRQALGDHPSGRHPHIDHDGLVGASQRGPVQVGISVSGMTGDKGHSLRAAAMGQGRAGTGRGGQGRGDARYDMALDASLAAGRKLLAATAKQERITALQAHDGQAFQRQGDQQLIDVILRQGVARLALGHVDAAGAGRREIQDFGRDQPVMHDNVGGLQNLEGLDGQQIRIARPRAHQMHHARRAHGLAPAENDETRLAIMDR